MGGKTAARKKAAELEGNSGVGGNKSSPVEAVAPVEAKVSKAQ